MDRRTAIALTIAASLVVGFASHAYGYGYTREEDPLLKAFKDALRSAREGDWPAARAAIAGAKWQTDELYLDFGVDLAPRLDAALAAKDLQATGNALANVVALALVQKFHWNVIEGLGSVTTARARLLSAEIYYDEVLSGNVRGRDQRAGTDRHGAVIAALGRAREAVGSAGLFGVGARPADPAAFRAAAEAVTAELRAAFPYLTWPADIGVRRGAPGGGSTSEARAVTPPATTEPRPVTRPAAPGAGR